MGMWRFRYGAEREKTEKVAQRLENATVPEARAVSFFETQNKGIWRVEALYDTENEARTALDLLTNWERALAIVSELPEENWVEKSLEGFSVVHAGRFLIHGAHHGGMLGHSDIPILMEAGIAFGTGHHGTTRGCLCMVDWLARRRRFKRALDVGCGTGILAIGVAKRFRIPLIASDIDPEAAHIARSNALNNQCGPFITALHAKGTHHHQIKSKAPYDLVMANILMGPLIAMAADLIAVMAKGGILLLSGLLVEQESRVLQAYRTRGLTLVHRMHLDGWSTLALTRPLSRDKDEDEDDEFEGEE